jgi:hypothetical protein
MYTVERVLIEFNNNNMSYILLSHNRRAWLFFNQSNADSTSARSRVFYANDRTCAPLITKKKKNNYVRRCCKNVCFSCDHIGTAHGAAGGPMRGNSITPGRPDYNAISHEESIAILSHLSRSYNKIILYYII